MLHSPVTDDDYARLRGDLVRIVGQVCPGWLASRRDDMVQAVVMRVMDVQRAREGNAEISAFYLRKAAHSALVDEIRRLRRRPEVSLEDDSDAPAVAAATLDPERHASGRQTGRAIQSCLGTLVRPRRLAVVLHLQGHSVPEVGKLMSWTDKRAENLVYRGLADLRRCLERNGVTP